LLSGIIIFYSVWSSSELIDYPIGAHLITTHPIGVHVILLRRLFSNSFRKMAYKCTHKPIGLIYLQNFELRVSSFRVC
jgi:hypothetical protein